MINNRRDELLQFIQGKGESQLNELFKLYPGLSSMTVRRDLEYLEKKGLIVRFRGGVKKSGRTGAVSEDLFSERMIEHIEAKNIIAQKTLSFLEKDRSIFIDSGTTMMCLAKALPDEAFSIVTSGPNIGLEIIKKNNPTVTLVGGQLSRTNLTTSGVNAIAFIKSVNLDIALLAASGFSLKSGFSIGNYSECELKKMVIKKARKIIVLLDVSKIDKSMPYTFADLKDIDLLITDKSPGENILIAAEKYSVSVF